MVFPYESMMQGFGWGGVPWVMSPWMGLTLGVLTIWDAVWKGIGMWKAGRNNQLGWFIAILIVNSVGILPIIYLVWFQKKREVEVISEAKPQKKVMKAKKR